MTCADHVPRTEEAMPVRGACKEWQATPLLGFAKPRRMWRIDGLCDTRRFGVHNHCFDNVLRGLYERVLLRVSGGVAHLPVQPTMGVFDARLGRFRSRLVGLVPSCRPVTRQQFVEMYVGRKRAIYERAAASLGIRGLNKSDAYMSSFVKCEKLEEKIKKPDPAPRMIQPRSPRYNVEVGRYLKPMEKKLCKGIAEIWGGPTVMKGLNARGQGEAMRGMWDEFVRPVAIGFDATRFDQHVSVDALKFEHSCYEVLTALPARSKLRRLLKMQLLNKGFARCPDGTVKYAVEGRRMSGDMNTGMGNCLLMCAMMWAFARMLNIKARLANNGDDCVLFCERSHLPRIQAACDTFFREFGFVMEVEEPVFEFEKVSFCQTQPVNAGGWVMCRVPMTVMDKDLVSVLDLPNCFQKWAMAIGECGGALCAGVPVLQSFYQMLRRHGKAGKTQNHPWMDSGFAMLRGDMALKVCAVTPEARFTFWKAFGMLPDLQTAVEDELAHYQLTGSAGVTNPSLHRLRLTVVQ